MSEKILVVGGCGYVGTPLVSELLRTCYKVDVIDWQIYGNHLPFNRNLRCFKVDIRDSKIVRDVIEKRKPKIVIDLASISNDPMGDLNPQLTKDVNVHATKNLIDICKDNNVEKFIFASSSSVYGVNENENISEETPLAPVSLYSETKAVVEKYIEEVTTDRFETVRVRPATVCGYSPRQRLDLIVNLLTYNAHFKGKIVVEGGERVRPHIHIDDMVGVYMELVEFGGINGQIYNAGGEYGTLMELGKMVKRFTGCEIEEKEGPDKRSHRLNSEKIWRDLGIRFEKSVGNAVEDLIFAFENHLVDVDDQRVFNMRWYQEQIKNGVIKV